MKRLILLGILGLFWSATTLADTLIGTFWRGDQRVRVYEMPSGDKYSRDDEGRTIVYGYDRTFAQIKEGEHGTNFSTAQDDDYEYEEQEVDYEPSDDDFVDVEPGVEYDVDEPDVDFDEPDFDASDLRRDIEH